jgi:hypothetical protein
MSKVDINILGSALGEIAKAIGKITDAINSYMSNSEVRRMRRCIRYGDILIDRIKKLDVKDKVVDKYIKLWQKFNN